MRLLRSAVLSILLLSAAGIAHAGAPFNDLEGAGGVAFNPLAYPGGNKEAGPAGSTDKKTDQTTTLPYLTEVTKYVSKPQFGTWYVNLSDVGVNWFATGVSDVILDRLEVSYGFEAVAQKDAKSHNKHNIGAKLLVVPENFNDWKFVPAISIGSIYKHTDNIAAGAANDGWDGYIVATKLITQLPRPVLVSGGTLLTNSYATGVFGYDKKDSLFTLFGNVDVVLTDHIIIGAEFKQGAHFKNWKDANYWDLHTAWTVNKELTIIAAYVNAGDHESSKRVGLGNGLVLSAQYAF